MVENQGALTSSLHILIADDDPVMRNVLGNFLKSEGHTVVLAEDGAHALELFEKDKDFGLFVLDVKMPHIDGLSCCARIKKQLTRWVPIMMVSANSEERSQVEGLDIGADYYLTKPVQFALLRAYVRAAQRASALQNEVQEKSRRLEDYYNKSQSDNDLARQLLDRLLHSSESTSLDAKYIIDPAGEFSGDLIVSMRSPSHRLYSMVADATGHGLPAAITLIPAVETFSRLSREGYSVETIVRELNTRLRSSLPRERFVAAAVMMFEPHTQRLEIWNGGCPQVYLLDNESRQIAKTFPATHPPLGILDAPRFDAKVTGASYQKHQTIVACTDGVVESEDPSGNMFGQKGLERVLTCHDRSRDLIRAIGSALDEFTAAESAADDRSLLILPLGSIEFEGEDSVISEDDDSDITVVNSDIDLTAMATGGWYFALGVRGDALKDAELAPIVNNVIGRMGVTGEKADKAHVCITELLNNAIDHGVLGMDSSLKSNPEGFAEYFEERQKRLSQLDYGGVFIRANLDRSGRNYALSVTVSDTGEGFGYKDENATEASSLPVPSGRGIKLVRRLADRLTFHDGGATSEFRIVIMAGESGQPQQKISEIEPEN
ncbi:SpoIIE family protein phosphatase [Marinobacter sp. CHS3-4]|uniref:ATP-binding SpoIIE family protein phosphatase n=1 Tax=Marinobacter sp. CHS3-4 TaxID=3045174 RepID=UPI0024B4D9EC|nr:SpoIIE family protein phosphatase [Marinobacter sp. CHS3-4]MDI9245627.1 SpoIIE family protein phosphatase [Marinobacter sp. CHS3-4]